MQTMYIMQGPPGGGKSTLGRCISQASIRGQIRTCSTDDLFVTNGKYEFKLSDLALNHQKNQDLVRLFLKNGDDIIVDNANIRAYEAKPYVKMAVEMGIPVVFIRVDGSFESTDGVPKEKIEAMRAYMENLSVEACLASKAPWENE